MKIRLVTDTAADLPREIIEKGEIVIVPHIITIDDRNLKLGIDISIEELYNKMKTMNFIPKSSTPSMQDFLIVFQESFEKLGYDHIIYVSVAEKLSATLAVARIAAKDFKDKITLIDTESASGVQGLLLIAVLNMLEDNIPLEEIVKKIKELRDQYLLDVGFFTLENVYKSGRLKSKFILNLTRFIKIKPIAIMERPGILHSTLPGFVFKSHMENRLKNIILRRANREISYDMIISHVENQESANNIAKKIMNKIEIQNFHVTEASPIVGSHTGFGTVIVSLVPSYR